MLRLTTAVLILSALPVQQTTTRQIPIEPAKPAAAQQPASPATPTTDMPAPTGAQDPWKGNPFHVEGLYHIGGNVQPPVLIHSVEPEFSEEARTGKFSGAAMVYLVVDEKGIPTHVSIAKSIGHGLDENAVKAVRQYRFKPATLNGVPVKVDLYININFTQFK